MTLAAFIFVLIGFLLVVALMLAARTDPEESSPAISDDAAPPSPFSRESAAHLLSRIFSASDLQYVQRQNNPHVLRLFRHERKRVALLFLGDLRARTHQIKTVHARAALNAIAPNPGAEVRIAVGYFSILFFTAMLSLLVQIFGISAIRFLAAPASALAAHLSRLAQISQSVRDVAENSAVR
jgi:hypothetical protein